MRCFLDRRQDFLHVRLRCGYMAAHQQFGELCIAIDNRIDDTPVLLQSAQGPAANPFVMDAEDADQRIILSRQHVEEQRVAAEFCYRYLDILVRSEEHTSELQSLMRISYAVFC